MKTIQFIGLIGRPGSGKDTLGEGLATHFPNSWLQGVGQIIRDSNDPSNRYHELCVELRSIANLGNLPQDEQVIPLLDRLVLDGIEAGFDTIISSGTPRTEGTARHYLELFDFLREQGYQIQDQYLYLLTRHDIADERIRIRRETALTEGKIVRIDDDPEMVPRRGVLHERITFPAGRLLTNLGKLHIIDGGRSKEEVLSGVLRVLNEEIVRPVDEVTTEIKDRFLQGGVRPMTQESRMERR